jgi:nicotinamidase-related amidase
MMADVMLNPQTTALLLQDLQNELIKGSRPIAPLSGGNLIANCQKLLAKARAVGMPVIYVRVSRRPDLRDAPRPPLGTSAGAGGIPSLIEGTEGAAIVTELAPRAEDVVVTKHTTM